MKSKKYKKIIDSMDVVLNTLPNYKDIFILGTYEDHVEVFYKDTLSFEKKTVYKNSNGCYIKRKGINIHLKEFKGLEYNFNVKPDTKDTRTYISSRDIKIGGFYKSGYEYFLYLGRCEDTKEYLYLRFYSIEEDRGYFLHEILKYKNRDNSISKFKTKKRCTKEIFVLEDYEVFAIYKILTRNVNPEISEIKDTFCECNNGEHDFVKIESIFANRYNMVCKKCGELLSNYGKLSEVK